MILLLASLALAPPALSVKVDGDGYLRLAREGRVVYATQATFQVADGHLVTTGGAQPLPQISVPTSATAIQIDLQGEVFAVIGGTKSLVGQLVLALFPKGATLLPENGFLLASDRPTLGTPGEGLNGVIRGGTDLQPVPGKPANPVQALPKANLPTTPVKTNPPTRAATTVTHRPITGAEIVIRPESTVRAESFILSEVADIRAEPNLATKLGGVDMGRAPIVGVTRGIDTSFVLAKLRTAGYKLDNITVTTPQGAHLMRASQNVTTAQMLEAAQAAVKDQLGFDLPLRFTNDQSEILAPVGKLDLQANTALKTSNGITLMIDVRVDDKHWTSRTLQLAPIHTGGGVKVGQVVKITVKLNGASLQCTGRVKSAGWIGETVSVLTDTGAIQSGTVTGPDTVEVKL